MISMVRILTNFDKYILCLNEREGQSSIDCNNLQYQSKANFKNKMKNYELNYLVQNLFYIF